jgi:hypothetical protein
MFSPRHRPVGGSRPRAEDASEARAHLGLRRTDERIERGKIGQRVLYHLFRALDDAGLAPGMTSGFRDDYRQSIATGNKAASNSSYHGGSRRGGYGHGLAADVVSVKGETRPERWSSSERLWKWIDAHGKEFGIGRPYLDKDPPHIAPIDGKEYADHRGVNWKLAGRGRCEGPSRNYGYTASATSRSVTKSPHLATADRVYWESRS